MLVLRGSMPVGSTILVWARPLAASQRFVALTNAGCEPNAHVEAASA